VRQQVTHLLNSALDLLYPPRCFGCGRVDAVWCARCAEQLDAVVVELNPAPLPPLLSISATGTHAGKLQQAVHALKYAHAQQLTVPLGSRLLKALSSLHWQIDVVIPVPLHEARQRERGYNQARWLGEYVAQMRGIPCQPGAIERWRDTPSQVGRSRAERQANVSGAFRAATPLAERVLLIDDVFTTGATLQACALAAQQAGAQAVYALTVSAAPHP
jgi:ComF family protein